MRWRRRRRRGRRQHHRGSVSGGTSADGEADEYCAALSGYKAATDAADPVLASGDATPEELETAFTSLSDHLDPMLETAPEEISADLELVVGKSRELIDALAANDYDLVVVGEDPANAELLASLDSAEYTEATERIDDYGEATCGIRIDEG